MISGHSPLLTPKSYWLFCFGSCHINCVQATITCNLLIQSPPNYLSTYFPQVPIFNLFLEVHQYQSLQINISPPFRWCQHRLMWLTDVARRDDLFEGLKHMSYVRVYCKDNSLCWIRWYLAFMKHQYGHGTRIWYDTDTNP